MSKPECSIVWFRDDLRLSDQPALSAAAQSGLPLIALYIADANPALRPLGGAAKFWLHHSLAALDADLRQIGGQLTLRIGDSSEVWRELLNQYDIKTAHWCRRYGQNERDIDARIKAELKASGVDVHSHNGHLLFEPWQVVNKTGGPFKVFTPFWRAALSGPPPATPLPAPTRLNGLAAKGEPLEVLNLLPTKPNWSAGLRQSWHIGEAGAIARLSDFLDHGIKGYKTNRDRPDLPATSRLSPHLRFGEISARSIFHAVNIGMDSGAIAREDGLKFTAELGWREFSYALLFQFPDLATQNFQARFDGFPWQGADPALVRAWQRGQTGYPLVDAGMRELWQTGTMHNRVRMVVASFLIKHLMIDWRIGENWFWDTLVDADPASNAASWQWVAGSGADAAPFFRIFNPVIQGEKFDPNGDYIRKFVPELADCPTKFIHSPWERPATPGHRSGLSYPSPIVDHAEARDRALRAFQELDT